MANEKIQDIKNRFGIVGNSPGLMRALETAVKVAPTDISVLILGESGVGKENISKIIHHLSRRKHNGFIAINCGAIPGGTIDSELFGHEKGAFTSAHEARKGYFETVDGGTIFLDEIGELPLETQSRLLRVLESGEFIRVGSSKVQKTNVRIIAATNKDLLNLSNQGKFREDLYYRLSSVTIKIPSLKERKEDLAMLFAKFSSDLAEKYRVPPLELTPSGLQKFQQYSFPGNIRQLRNMVEQMSILETEREVNAEVVSRYLPEEPVKGLTVIGEGKNANNFTERELLYQFLFDIKKDVAELRNVVYELVKNNLSQGNNNEPDGASNMSAATKLLAQYSTTAAMATAQAQAPSPINHDADNDEFDYVIHEDEETNGHESLSLQNVEKDMILKALSKHKGKRKLAAAELGISERTLYRKIKEYKLEQV